MPHSLYDRNKDSTYVGFYDSVFEKPDMWPRGIEFSEASGLGKDVHGILQRYQSQDMEWFHIMVKHDAFPIFCREMETIRDEFVLLPFWCLCDGLEVNEKALLTSYKVSYKIARCKKPHTIAEELILPAAIEIVETMFGDNFAKELQSIPLSNDTVSRQLMISLKM
ncbi:uncharacterized protein TNCV_3606481 [Trichonephila clavipes]|nr:uncharacterized protein TNCV_3606481 [Trichonephila clavipes]